LHSPGLANAAVEIKLIPTKQNNLKKFLMYQKLLVINVAKKRNINPTHEKILINKIQKLTKLDLKFELIF